MECTINRVHEEYFDQYAWSGHRTRLSEDVASIASLGIKTLRTALHWEYCEATQDWTFFDQTMEELKRKDIVPVVGLLHHGSGPRQTDLLDPDFPGKLAAYALQVAERYPSVVQYTPVNEPNTTSRFACLYGHWYPHHRSMESYIRALVNQIKATVLSMQAIRTVQPLAELVYTEDGGGIFSTPAMEAFRIAREHRRWLGTDLLCGLVTAGHPLFPLDVLVGAPEKSFSLLELARMCNSSVFHFSRSFRAHLGKAPFAFQRELRVQKARNLLRHTDFSVEEISVIVGCESASSFARIFRRATSQSPREFRSQLHDDLPR